MAHARSWRSSRWLRTSGTAPNSAPRRPSRSGVPSIRGWPSVARSRSSPLDNRAAGSTLDSSARRPFVDRSSRARLPFRFAGTHHVRRGASPLGRCFLGKDDRTPGGRALPHVGERQCQQILWGAPCKHVVAPAGFPVVCADAGDSVRAGIGARRDRRVPDSCVRGDEVGLRLRARRRASARCLVAPAAIEYRPAFTVGPVNIGPGRVVQLSHVGVGSGDEVALLRHHEELAGTAQPAQRTPHPTREPGADWCRLPDALRSRRRGGPRREFATE